MPYITEEIWQRVAPLSGVNEDTIMLQAYPTPDSNKINQDALDEMQWLQDFVLGTRQIRSGYNIKPGQLLPVLLQNGSDLDQQRLAHNQSMLLKLARLENIQWLAKNDKAPESATALVGEMQLLIPMAGLINVAEERKRLTKEIDSSKGFISKLKAKLANENFISRAPENVVKIERQKLSDAQTKLNSLAEQFEKLKTL
jgi:valyl-tRNA synthetase